jgi:hypothetical protein
VLADPIAVPWTPACMEPDELAAWGEMNGRVRGSGQAQSPCTDCRLAFAIEMRAIGRCNGTPRGVEEDTEMGTFDYTAPDQPEPKEAPRALTMTRRV